MSYLRFGTFLPPIHPVWENPNLALERDVAVVQHLDRLGYDEAWIGEHHSGGAELIASPELFIATVAERTKHIRLGTGVNSLPYHNPFMLADRFMQLHNMTQGRAMFGVGPGALISDALMIGIEPMRQRDMMEEALDCILRLFRGETVTCKTDWFDLREARLQLAPYGGQDIEVCTASLVSPYGPRIAGKFGTGMLGLSATSAPALAAAKGNWQIACDTAERHGNRMTRDSWRMVGLMHVAESREQALKDVEYGLDDWVEYFEKIAVIALVPPERKKDAAQHMMETGMAVIGTPDDCVAQIEKLVAASGGFGCYLVTDHNWASFDRKLNSYELLARYVMPRFQQSNDRRLESRNWVAARQKTFQAQAEEATAAQFERHRIERAKS